MSTYVLYIDVCRNREVPVDRLIRLNQYKIKKYLAAHTVCYRILHFKNGLIHYIKSNYTRFEK